MDVSLEKMSKAEGKKARALKINQAVLNLICGTGIPPTIVDTDEWKNFISTIDNGVSTFSSTSFVDTYIPGEAARITEEKIQMLSKVKNLTISYDGGTTKAVESIYTIHVTTPRQRQAYLIEGNEASGVSHTGPQIANELFKVDFILHTNLCVSNANHIALKVMDRIGRKNFSGISSDSTGNTRLAREIVAKSIPWIIILPDVCHLLNNTAKDISKIPFFIDVSMLGTAAQVGYLITNIHVGRQYLIFAPLSSSSESLPTLNGTSLFSGPLLTSKRGLLRLGTHGS